MREFMAITKALADPNRVRILLALRRRELCVCQITELFGFALGPCTFAYMAPMLAVTFKLAKSAPLYGASLLLAYGVGHCAVIVAAGTSTELVQRFLNWNEQSKGVTIVKCICGALVLIAGLYLLWSA
jgi:cytochrome c-type biogenesis protein